MVTSRLMTMLMASGAALAGVPPSAEPPAARPVVSESASVLAPQPFASGDANAPWRYENLITYRPAGMSPLKPTDDTPPAEPETKVPATVENLHRADGG